MVKQVGGDHYASEYEHWDWWIDLGMGYAYCVGNATKYLVRYREKNGIEDLRKALSYLQKLWTIPVHRWGQLPTDVHDQHLVERLTEHMLKGRSLDFGVETIFDFLVRMKEDAIRDNRVNNLEEAISSLKALIAREDPKDTEAQQIPMNFMMPDTV